MPNDEPTDPIGRLHAELAIERAAREKAEAERDALIRHCLHECFWELVDGSLELSGVQYLHTWDDVEDEPDVRQYETVEDAMQELCKAVGIDPPNLAAQDNPPTK